MEHTDVYGSARMGEYLIMAIKKIAACSILLDDYLHKWNTRK